MKGTGLYLQIVCLLISLYNVSSRSVEVDVRASWPQFPTSTLAEVSEYVFEESKESYWKFLKELCLSSEKVENVIKNTTAENIIGLQEFSYELSAAHTTKHTTGNRLMEAMLDFGYYSPTVQFYNTLAQKYGNPCDSEAFVVIYPGEVVSCQITFGWVMDYANSSYDQSAVEILGPNRDEWDHIYRNSSSELLHPDLNVVLYGALGSQKFCELRQNLTKLVNRGRLHSFSFRHAVPGMAAVSNSTSLQGFGVFLDIKNMEYKNVDEDASTDKVEEENLSNHGPVEFSPSEEVAGINFAKLHTQLPGADEELRILREELIRDEATVDGGSMEQMKVWKMKDLGLQTLQVVYSAGARGSPADAMLKLSDIVGNFPRWATQISSTKVSPALKEHLGNWYHSELASTIPSNSVFVNGLRTDLGGHTFNLFDFLDELRDELGSASSLASLGLSSAQQLQVISIANSVGKEDSAGGVAPGQSMPKVIRIDVSKGAKQAVHFINNLEKDPMYKSMPKSLKALMYPSWTLHSIARNMYTLIAFVDPLSVPGATLLLQLQMLLQQQYPVRVGFSVSCADPEGSGKTLRKDFCRLFAGLKETKGEESGLNFATYVSNKVLEAFSASADPDFFGDPTADIEDLPDEETFDATQFITRSSLLEACSTAGGKRKTGDKWLADGEFQEFIDNSNAYLEARGLTPNSFSMNGIVVQESSLEGQLMQLLSREQFILQSMFRSKQISDKTKSIFSTVLAKGTTFSRYHPMLEDKEPEYADFNSEKGKQLLRGINFFRPLLSEDVTAETLNYFNYPSTTIFLQLPLNAHGFKTAASALRFAKDAAHQRKAAERGEQDAGDQEGSYQVGIVWTTSSLLAQDDRPKAEYSESDSIARMEAEDPLMIKRTLNLLRGIHYNLGFEFDPLDVPNHQRTRGSTYKKRVLGRICGGLCTTTAIQILEMLAAGETPMAVYEKLLDALKPIVEPDAPEDYFFLSKSVAKLKKNLQDSASAEECFAKSVEISKLATEVFESEDLLKNEALLVVGGRKLVSTDLKKDSTEPHSILNLHDLSLLLKIEHDRLGSALTHLLGDGSTTLDTSAELGERYKERSAMLLQLSSFCGRTSSADGGSPRFEVGSKLEEMAELDLDSLVYHLEPPLTNFDSGLSDLLQIQLVVDPLSVAGQRGIALLQLLRDQLQVPVTVVLVPKPSLSEFPLQNFYRYVSADEGPSGAIARFQGLPRQHVLTVRVDIPEPWNVQSSAAVQDIDNLRCTSRACGDPAHGNRELTKATYQLKNLLVYGQCVQTKHSSGNGEQSSKGKKPKRPRHVGYPPNGLQLTLSPLDRYQQQTLDLEGTGKNVCTSEETCIADLGNTTKNVISTRTSDTLVMQNLGYFQLQADAGLYVLQLAEGRATELYSIEGAAEGGLFVPVRTFGDATHHLMVAKRPGMEGESLLEDDEDPEQVPRSAVSAKGKKGEKGLWDKFSNKFFNGKEEVPEDETIHVFSLATGHLYERLLRIMMLSVKRHTKSPVKFWLFENFLSPTFKQTADAMALEFDFQVEYVTYKWPKWLTQQTQQQRIIWGYKILFLDVLFPLDVKKVIYVDADQVVRADLKELWDMDLQGRPYGYTPFCTSRQETLGFQFWNQGYWKEHLRGRPYHISALYVVDLQRFRRGAVGDRLRAVYDQLSRDPNSLANLDQDLPNYAQHAVPIFSLPQEWLWCETWCSEDSKTKAKTIDLCNNPLHKESKLDMAKRVISGKLFNQSWVQLDEEIRSLQEQKGLIEVSHD